MIYSYTCPHCFGLLNPGDKVVFLVESGIRRAIFLLSPTPGDYTEIHCDSFPLNAGQQYTFRCPICHENLQSELDDHLVELSSRDQDGNLFTVHFSSVYGERATFLRSKESFQRFGEDAAAYEGVNFFGAGERDE